ncbi:unnamed protein product, partial [Iphiclides podalirius]
MSSNSIKPSRAGALRRTHVSSMEYKVILAVAALVAVASGKSVFVGQIYDHSGVVRKVYEKAVEASAIPLIKREQEVYFEYPLGDQKIKGIAIKDLENGLADASINRGGLGFNFVNVKLKSERGSGFKYLIEIYA